MSSTETTAPIHTAEGRYGVFLVELTPDGYRIRHGRYSGYGRGIWHSRWKACRAADHLADGEIPAALLADRVSTDALEADLRERESRFL